MAQKFWAAAISAVAPLHAIAADNPPILLDRVGQWVVDCDQNSCHLAARFGTMADPLFLKFTRYQPGDTFDLQVYGGAVKGSGSPVNVSADFGLAKPVSRAAKLATVGTMPLLLLQSVRVDGDPPRGVRPALDPVTPGKEAAVRALVLKWGRKLALTLRFGPLDKPLAALRACTDQLVQSWGYDPQVQASLSRSAQPLDAAHWIRDEDYPSDAQRKDHVGIVHFRIDVAASGATTGCEIIGRTEPDDFGTVACKVLRRRARFAPALDAAGRPVASFFISQIHFNLIR